MPSSWGRSWGGAWGNSWGLLDALVQRVEQATAGFIRRRKRFKWDGPTEDQIRAERIRLGIIEARKERTQVLKKAQKVEKGSEQAQELRLYAYLLKSEIDRLQAEYEALKAELEQQGAIIRSAVITRMVMAMLEEEIRQARQEEDDIAFLLAMLAEI